MKASRYRPTRVQVDVAAISYNVEQIASLLPERTQVYAVVKANAYGHGAVAVARELADQVDGFCLSNLDEALELRQAGLAHPLLVMGVVPIEAVSLAKQEEVSLTVTSLEWVEAVLAAGETLAGLKFHAKVDTGMGRLGFRDKAELETALALLRGHGALVEGIFTHFASADQADWAQFDQQLQTFKDLLAGLSECPPLIHASNSATSLWHGEAVFNMVRLGNAIYGLNPSGHAMDLPLPLKPALSVTSALIQVKQVPAGQSIGYGGTYTSETAEWIGTVPIGYADGFPRSMQGFSVLVDGHACPVVGRVSMDQITIRLPQSYPIGTSVVLLGRQGNQIISAQDWADYQETINYEVVCALSDRIFRDYIGS